MTTTLTPVYGSSAAFTVTNLHSIATSSTFVAGWKSAVVDNSSNISVSEVVAGSINAGTSPTVSTNILIYVWQASTDVPAYPDAIDGSEGTVTLTSANVRDAGAFKLAQAITIDSTSDRAYPFSFDVASLFGGHMPKRWGLYVTHNTGVNLKSATSVINRIPLKYQNA